MALMCPWGEVPGVHAPPFPLPLLLLFPLPLGCGTRTSMPLLRYGTSALKAAVCSFFLSSSKTNTHA